jgi:hypothetical protein
LRGRLENAAKLTISRDATGHQHGAHASFPRRGQRAGGEIAHDCGLKFGDDIQRRAAAQQCDFGSGALPFLQDGLARRDFRREFGVIANVIENRCLDSAEAEIVWVAAQFWRCEFWRGAIPATRVARFA